MGKRKVLLVVEGAQREVELFEKLFSVYELDMDYEIYSYRTNIYDLYQRMFLDGDPDDLSFLGVLREKASPDERGLFEQDYSDVLLVFDYDPQDNRFSPERLEEMQAYFNESTDEGKLYINYPMVEACKHYLKCPITVFSKGLLTRARFPTTKRLWGEMPSTRALPEMLTSMSSIL